MQISRAVLERLSDNVYVVCRDLEQSQLALTKLCILEGTVIFFSIAIQFFLHLEQKFCSITTPYQKYLIYWQLICYALHEIAEPQSLSTSLH